MIFDSADKTLYLKRSLFDNETWGEVNLTERFSSMPHSSGSSPFPYGWVIGGTIGGALVLMGVAFVGYKVGLRNSHTPYREMTPIGISLEEGKEIELIPLKGSSTYFAYDDNSNICKTSWVDSSDAILFYDYNESKRASHFSKIVLTSWSNDALTDFEALLEVFDTTKDEIFNKKDNEFNNFYLWQDKNSNGIAEDGELLSLEELVEKIDFTDIKAMNKGY